ncbi:MAG: aminotransferase class I/II-fold pyridoxal phosphate-dependent enzyme [Deinococcus-Thermus bacterium]|nr:aminotransferase class I/II-fold pyridoxal phosphate-dependent enzyme [Deinococcota bacterium]
MSAGLPLAGRTERMRPSAIREILKLTQRSDVLSLAGGLPASELFPVDEVADAAAKVMAESGVRALQYGPSDGLPELRASIAAAAKGADPDRVVVTSGSQQGLDLLGKLLIDPGAAVAVAAPSYMGALRAFDPYEPRYLTIESDRHGMRPEALEAALAQRPSFVYVIPDFDNPSGSRMSLERREALLEAADRHGVLIVEDAPYRELRFADEELPTLFEMAPDRVVHLGTLSKTLAPGLRVAWVIAPSELAALLERAKQSADLHTSTFTQSIAMELLERGVLRERLPRLRAFYQAQRDALADALAAEVGDVLRFERPPGGMFLWAALPEGLDAGALLVTAVEHGVAFVPGAPFYANGGPTHTLRLSYSLPSHAELAEGARRLAGALAEHRRAV